MRGIVYTGEGVEVSDELAVRDPGPKEVRIGVRAAGVCHSTCRSSTGPSRGHLPPCSATRVRASSKRSGPTWRR